MNFNAGEVIRQQLEDIYRQNAGLPEVEHVQFHPPRMVAEQDRFGIAIAAMDGTILSAGDDEYTFPMQSICKVFTYAMLLEELGREATLQRVGVEPTGDSFYSFAVDERNNRPSNAMVNAGALVVVNLLQGGSTQEKVERIVERMRIFAANPELDVDQYVLADEMNNYSDRNLGLSYLLRSMGMLSGDVHDNIEVYLAACSVRVSVRDLAVMGATLANGGINPVTGEQALERKYVRDVITVMTTCGMYDAAGEWAYDIGIPAKSSVSGAILLAMPTYFGGAIFSPGLDEYGTSIRGVAVCDELSAKFGLHMFADPAEDRFGRWSNG